MYHFLLTFRIASAEGLSREAVLTPTERSMSHHGAEGVDTTGTGAGIHTLQVPAVLVHRAVRGSGALGPAWCAEVARRARTHEAVGGARAADAVRTTGVRVACIRFRHGLISWYCR